MNSEQTKNSQEPPMPLMPLRTTLHRLVLIVVLLNLFVIALAAVLLHRSRQERLHQADIATQNLANVLEQKVGGSIGQIDILLQATVDEIERQFADGGIKTAALNRYLTRQRQRIPALNSLRVADAAADTLYGTDGAPGPPRNIAGRDYFRQLRDNPGAGLVIGTPVVGMISKKSVLLFARRINQPDGDFAGVVLCGIPLERFTGTFAGMNVGRQGLITLRGQDLSVISASSESTAPQNVIGRATDYPHFRQLVQSGRNRATFRVVSPFDAVERTISFQKIGSHPLYLTVGLANDDVLAVWRSEAVAVAAALGFFLLCSVTSAGFIYSGRKREHASEEERYRQHQLFELLIDNLPALVYLKDREGRLLACCQKLADFLGVSREQALGKTSRDLLPPEIAEQQMAADALVVNSGTVVKTMEQIVAADGLHLYETVKLPLRNAAGQITGLCGISSDVTEQQQLANELKNSEERYRLLFEKSGDAIFITRPDSTIVSANPAACRMFGMSVAEFCRGGRAAIVDTSDERLPAALATRERYGEFIGELRFVRKNGEIFPAEIVSNIFKDSVGGIRATVRIRDISQRMQADAALHKKTAEMEQFTYSVSHDMRSPLVTVKTFLGYLQQDLAAGLSERVVEDLQYIQGAADKMELMLGELLELSRVGRVSNTPVAVSCRELVAEACAAVAGRIVATKIEVQATELDLQLYGDRPRLAQVWQNLLDNAVKYMGDQNQPLVQMGAELQGAETVFFVSDNGIGLEPDQCQKIFGIFTKLDSRSAGAGLGLATVKRIVELYGGRVWVESAGLGQGACFKFTLPGAVAAEK